MISDLRVNLANNGQFHPRKTDWSLSSGCLGVRAAEPGLIVAQQGMLIKTNSHALIKPHSATGPSQIKRRLIDLCRL